MHKDLCFKLSLITGVDSYIKYHPHMKIFSWNHIWKNISQRLKVYLLILLMFINNYTLFIITHDYCINIVNNYTY